MVRDVRMVIYARAVQPNQSGHEHVDLVVDAAQHVPGDRTVTELVNGSQTVISDCWGKVSELLNAAASIGQRAVHLKIERRVRRLHIVEVRISENTIPERSLRLQAEAPNDI